MNRTCIFPVLMACCAVTFLSQCKSGPPPAPGSADYAGVQKTAYERGYYRGVQDGEHRLDANHERYFQEYTAEVAGVFEKGYALGYEAGRKLVVTDPGSADNAYALGQEAGRTDAENGRSPLASRHSHDYDSGSEASFRQGYRAGFDQGRRQTE